MQSPEFSGQWQDIKSVPKFTAVDLWARAGSEFSRVTDALVGERDFTLGRFVGSEFQTVTHPLDIATHWMPIPNPPHFGVSNGKDKACEALGGCPTCLKYDQVLDVGRCHWAVCHEHRSKWRIGENLFSGWRNQTDHERHENENLLCGYSEVDPEYWAGEIPFYGMPRQPVNPQRRQEADRSIGNVIALPLNQIETEYPHGNSSGNKTNMEK